MVQYNAALVITSAIKVTSRDRIFRIPCGDGLVRFCFLHKVINGLLPVYLQSYIIYCGEAAYQTRSVSQNNLKQFSRRAKISGISFSFLIVLKSGIILVRSFGKLNKQINLKPKFSVSTGPKKTQLKLNFSTGPKKTQLKLNFYDS